MIYLIDTDVLIWISRGETDTKNKLVQIAKNNELAISTITIAELYQGIRPHELVNIEEMINKHIQFELTPIIARKAGLYWQEFNRAFNNISLNDCIIAATANEHSATVITYNIKHYPMNNIKVIKPEEFI